MVIIQTEHQMSKGDSEKGEKIKMHCQNLQEVINYQFSWGNFQKS